MKLIIQIILVLTSPILFGLPLVFIFHLWFLTEETMLVSLCVYAFVWYQLYSLERSYNKP